MTTTTRLSPSELINVMALVNVTGDAAQHRAAITTLNNNVELLQRYFPGWTGLPVDHIQWVSLICQVKADLLVPYKRGEVTPAEVLRAIHDELNPQKGEIESDPLLGPFRPKVVRICFGIEEKGWTSFAKGYRQQGRIVNACGRNGKPTSRLVKVRQSVFTECGVTPPK